MPNEVEKQPITTQRLLEDNYSARADANLESISQLRKKGEIPVVWACSDARLVLPDISYQIRTIAATGPRSPWANALNYQKSSGIIILDHRLCGGLATRAQLPENITDEDSALGFVKDHVWSSDPIIQSILTGSWTSSRTKKPVMSTVQDPLDGSTYPQAMFKNGDQTEHKTIPTYLLMPGNYIQEQIYGEEMPSLAENLIKEPFFGALKQIKDKAYKLQEKYPDFRQRQTIQDPEVIALVSNLKSLSARFPTLFGEPNTAFQVSLKRQSLDEEGELNSKDVIEAFRQIHYPISNSVESNKGDNSAFRNTRVVYIETGDMKVSRKLVKQIQRRDWMQKWLELPGRVIIASEAIAGKITQIEEAAA